MFRFLICLLVASAAAFTAPASLKSQSALRVSGVSMGPKKKAEGSFGLTEFLMSGRDGKLELLSGATRKEDVAKRFDITYDTRPRKATKSTGNAKSGTINPKDA